MLTLFLILFCKLPCILPYALACLMIIVACYSNSLPFCAVDCPLAEVLGSGEPCLEETIDFSSMIWLMSSLGFDCFILLFCYLLKLCGLFSLLKLLFLFEAAGNGSACFTFAGLILLVFGNSWSFILKRKFGVVSAPAVGFSFVTFVNCSLDYVIVIESIILVLTSN